MYCRSYNSFFSNFSNKTNLEIISVLRTGPSNVKGLVEKTGQEQSAVSHNMKKMLDCRIVDVKRNGKERIYSLNKDTVLPILKLVEVHVSKNCRRCTLHDR